MAQGDSYLEIESADGVADSVWYTHKTITNLSIKLETVEVNQKSGNYSNTTAKIEISDADGHTYTIASASEGGRDSASNVFVGPNDTIKLKHHSHDTGSTSATHHWFLSGIEIK